MFRNRCSFYSLKMWCMISSLRGTISMSAVLFINKCQIYHMVRYKNWKRYKYRLQFGEEFSNLGKSHMFICFVYNKISPKLRNLVTWENHICSYVLYITRYHLRPKGYILQLYSIYRSKYFWSTIFLTTYWLRFQYYGISSFKVMQSSDYSI